MCHACRVHVTCGQQKRFYRMQHLTVGIPEPENILRTYTRKAWGCPLLFISTSKYTDCPTWAGRGEASSPDMRATAEDVYSLERSLRR